MKLNISMKFFFFIIFNYIDYQLNIELKSIHLNFDKDVLRKLSRNWTCFIHAICSILFSLNFMLDKNDDNYSLMENVSCGYFLFDFIYIIRYDKITILSYAYLYHHIASIYILLTGREYYVYKILFWAELSNIPSYIVYHHLKIKDNSVLFWKNIQKMMYIIIRIPVLGYLTFDIIQKVDNKYPIYFCLPVYLMGIIWSLILLNDKK